MTREAACTVRGGTQAASVKGEFRRQKLLQESIAACSMSPKPLRESVAPRSMDAIGPWGRGAKSLVDSVLSLPS